MRDSRFRPPGKTKKTLVFGQANTRVHANYLITSLANLLCG